MRPVIRELKTLYNHSQLIEQTNRYKALRGAFVDYFKSISENARFFSAPASTVLCGNQTAHNNGKVFAASVNADVIAVAETTDDNFAVVKPSNSEEIRIDLSDTAKRDDESGTVAALIRGILDNFRGRGLKTGGFRAYVFLDAASRTGLSLAAPFEVLIAQMMSSLFNDGKVELSTLASVACKAEEDYFGRTTNLTSQTACAFGGFASIDFKDDGAPIVEVIPYDLNKCEHTLCIINLGNTSKYDDDINEIKDEMRAVAGFFECENLRSLSISDVILNINELRRTFGDRAVLRAIHFFRENNRVERMVHALKKDNIADFMNAISESGNSSFKYLQNVYSDSDVRHQDMSIAFNTAEYALHRKGALRVCSEGYTGTLQAFVPHNDWVGFKMVMERTIGAGKCHAMAIRPTGVCEVTL